MILVSRIYSWVLNSSWFLSWTLELFLIHLSCSLIDLWFTWVVLWLIFELFVITFVIIFCYHHCYHQNTFESPLIHHEAMLLQSPPFWWWQLLKSRNTHTHFFLVNHSHKLSPFIFEFILHLKFNLFHKYLKIKL